jgi:hypothetical protein
MVTTRFYLLLILFGCTFQAISQHDHKPVDSLITAKWADFDFKGRFTAAVEHDQVNDYYLVDLSKLPSRFERVWFMNECFKLSGIVNIDPDIQKDRILFLAKKGTNEKEVLEKLDKTYQDTRIINDAWPDDKKSNWLSVNDKYK